MYYDVYVQQKMNWSSAGVISRSLICSVRQALNLNTFFSDLSYISH